MSPAPTSVHLAAHTWQVKQAAFPANGSTIVSPDQKASLFRTAAAASLLCLAAARLIKGKWKPRASPVRRAVISLNAAGANAANGGEPAVTAKDTRNTKNTKNTTQSLPYKVANAALVDVCPNIPNILSLPEILEPSLAVPDSRTVATQATVATPATPTSTTSATSATSAKSFACLCGKLGSARLVAGARHAQHRHARCFSGKAARRAVGRHLCERVVAPVLPSSFDASKTRTKIQLGLRVSSCMRSESGRESKLSSGVEGSEMGTCLNFVAHDLKVYMLDHGSALTATASDPRVRAAAQLLRKHGM